MAKAIVRVHLDNNTHESVWPSKSAARAYAISIIAEGCVWVEDKLYPLHSIVRIDVMEEK